MFEMKKNVKKACENARKLLKLKAISLANRQENIEMPTKPNI